VFGFDLFEDQRLLRKNMSVCPQHNVLFDYLTVREHLELYAQFKGVG
jgi:ATP-binding cassette subfamily A (ABC1) protein 3